MSDQRTLKPPSLGVDPEGKKLTIVPHGGCMVFICGIIDTKTADCTLLVNDCDSPYEDYKGLKISVHWNGSDQPSELTTIVPEEVYEDILCHTYTTDMAPQIAIFGTGEFQRVMAARFVGVQQWPSKTDEWFADISSYVT